MINFWVAIIESCVLNEEFPFNYYLPTKLSRTLDFPALCPPTTTIWGSCHPTFSFVFAAISWSWFTLAINSFIPVLIDILRLFHFSVWRVDKRKFSTATINDRQLSRQKIRQKISVIITNTNPPLQTLLFSRQNVNQNAKMNYFFNIIKSK